MNQYRINEELEIIGYLLKEPLTYGRKISKELHIPLTTTQRVLHSLEKENILESRQTGKNRMYTLKKNLISKSYIVNAENYKIIKLVHAYPLLTPLWEDILRKTPYTMVVLFGSYAKFIAKKNSDIDIFIETQDLKVKQDIEALNSKLSVKIGLLNPKDLLTKEIIKNHVILKGVERFYGQLKFFE